MRNASLILCTFSTAAYFCSKESSLTKNLELFDISVPLQEGNVEQFYMSFDISDISARELQHLFLDYPSFNHCAINDQRLWNQWRNDIDCPER